MSGDLLQQAYPLAWPERQRRTEYHRQRPSPFEVGFAAARDHLLNELRLLRARHVVISTNVPLRRDGLPYADFRQPEDPGVAVYFEREVARPENGAREYKPFVIACDKFNRVTANLRAIGLTVEALRSIARHGASEMLEQAFTGFAALPPAPPTDPPWWEVLDVPSGAFADEIRAAHRRLAAECHPDRGGDPARAARINSALAQAKEAGRA